MKAYAAAIIGLVIGLVIGIAAMYVAATPGETVKPMEMGPGTAPGQAVEAGARSWVIEDAVKPRLGIASAVARLFEGFSKVLVISGDDPVCLSFTSAIVGELRALGIEAHYRVFDMRGANMSDAERIARYAVSRGFDAVYIGLGGLYIGNETAASEAAKAILYALAEAGFNGTVIIHAPVYAATDGLRTLLSDEEIRDWLEGKSIRFFLPRPKEGYVELVYAKVVNGDLVRQGAAKVPIGAPPRLLEAGGLSKALNIRSGLVNIVAKYAFKNLTRPVIVVGRDEVCLGLGTALTALLKSRGLGASMVVVEYSNASIADVDGADAVYLALGGSETLSGRAYVVAEALKTALKSLAEAGFNGTVIIHAPAYAASRGLAEVLKDEEVARWLSSGVEIRFFKLETVNGTRVVRFYVGRVVERGGRYVVEARPYAEEPIT